MQIHAIINTVRDRTLEPEANAQAYMSRQGILKGEVSLYR